MREYEIIKIARMITENPDEVRTPPTSPGGLDDLDGFGDLPEGEDFVLPFPLRWQNAVQSRSQQDYSGEVKLISGEGSLHEYVDDFGNVEEVKGELTILIKDDHTALVLDSSGSLAMDKFYHINPVLNSVLENEVPDGVIPTEWTFSLLDQTENGSIYNFRLSKAELSDDQERYRFGSIGEIYGVHDGWD
jgi:hypothetical protein